MLDFNIFVCYKLGGIGIRIATDGSENKTRAAGICHTDSTCASS